MRGVRRQSPPRRLPGGHPLVDRAEWPAADRAWRRQSR
jgi:hypothetical protein